ncbi:hypothetical protein J3R83DRAFT_14058 [Lanmaoa asiatica]|nr:hypothetical protein J3R83DRAFT_14058 [Lanmaoa asiatica]
MSRWPYLFSPVTIIQVLDFTYCSYSFTMTSSSTTYRAIPRIVFGAALVILAVIPTLIQSVEMYRLTKRWQTNRTMKLLVREGVLYFVLYVSLVLFCHFYVSIVRPHLSLKKTTKQKLTTRMGSLLTSTLFFNILTVIQPGYPLPTDLMVFLVTLSYSVSCAIMPRFIISIRELYDHDFRIRSQGLDTGFGVFSQPITSGSTSVSGIALEDGNPEEGRAAEGDVDDSETIQLEVVGDGARQV